jgi:hypothetical protein
VASPSTTASAALGWIGRLVRKLIEGPVGTVVRFLSLDHNVLDVLERRAVHESAEFIAATMPKRLPSAREKRCGTLQSATPSDTASGSNLGVFKGYSINYLARRTDGRVFGFDSFRGLQEDWEGVGHTRSTFDLGGRLPRVRSNVSLVAGWFSDTLPGFLAANPAPLSLLHLDCDTYEATAEVLGLIMERLTPSTVIIMDDYHGFWGYRNGQFRAWAEFVAAHGLVYRYAAFNRHAVLVWNVQSGPHEPPHEQIVPQ